MRFEDENSNVSSDSRSADWELRLLYEVLDPKEDICHSHYAASKNDKPVGAMIELAYPYEPTGDGYKYDKEVENAAKELNAKYPKIISIGDDFDHDNILENYDTDARYIRLHLNNVMPNEDTFRDMLNNFLNSVLMQEGCRDATIQDENTEAMVAHSIAFFKQDVKKLELPSIPEEETPFTVLFKEYFLEKDPKQINADYEYSDDEEYSESEEEAVEINQVPPKKRPHEMLNESKIESGNSAKKSSTTNLNNLEGTESNSVTSYSEATSSQGASTSMQERATDKNINIATSGIGK